MASVSNLAAKSTAKNLGDYRDLGRGPFVSKYRALAAQTGFSPKAGIFARLGAFTSQFGNWWKWFVHVVKYLGRQKHPFQDYKAPETGIYDVPDQLKLAVTGDWGTGTDEAELVMIRMASQNPNYTIHLGDIYYVGDDPEVKQHCLGVQTESKYKAVKWLPGSDGSFALNGNHEMYALDQAYFTELLPTLGPKDPATCKPKGQGASFFCLKNKYWRVIGLDTGYYSTGWRTALSWISYIKFIRWFRRAKWDKPSCQLPDELMKWLPSALAEDRDGRVPGVILLSHHEYYSSFDEWYVVPAEQLKPLLGSRALLWYWGHEHRMALYARHNTMNGITAFGRCVGHGGMPVKRGEKPDIKDCNCVLYDDRKFPNKEGIDVGYNGYIKMEFHDASLRVDYFDLKNTLLLTESWTTDEKGILTGPRFSKVNPDRCLIKNDPEYIREHTLEVGPQQPPGS